MSDEKTSFLQVGPVEGALSSPAKLPYLGPRIVSREKTSDIVRGSAHCEIDVA